MMQSTNNEQYCRV